MVIFDAVKYAAKNFESGMSEEEIKRKLLDYGFSEYQASETIGKAKQMIGKEGIGSSNKRKMLIIKLISIFVAVLVLLIILYLIINRK